MRNAQSPHSELRTGLGSFRNTDCLRTIESLNLDIRSKHRLRYIDRKRAVKIGFPSFEYRMLRDVDDHVEIAGLAAGWSRVPFPCQAQAGSSVDAGRNINPQFLLDSTEALALALRTGVANDLAAPPAS